VGDVFLAVEGYSAGTAITCFEVDLYIINKHIRCYLVSMGVKTVGIQRDR
jgi:hypothetical protein